jgi:hypothetical protein
LVRVLLSRQVQTRNGTIIDSRSLRRSLNRTFRRRNGSLLGEGSALEDRCVQLVEGDPAFRLNLKYALEHAVQVVRDGENSLEEVFVLAECPEGRILERRTLPRVSAACKIDEDHSQRPNVVGSGSITCKWLRIGILILG